MYLKIVMKTLKTNKYLNTNAGSTDNKMIIKIGDEDVEIEKNDVHKKLTDNLSTSNDESCFGTVDEINSIESDNSTNPKDTIAILNINCPIVNSINLFQQQQAHSLDTQYQINQDLNQQQPKSSNIYDDQLVILNTSFHSSFTSSSSSTFSRRLEENRFLRYLCFCCTCCKTKNTMFWSWLSIFCCCCPLFGLFSLYCTYKSKKYKMKQNYELSDRYSSYAEKLNIAALIFGVLFYAVLFFIITLLLFMYWGKHNTVN